MVHDLCTEAVKKALFWACSFCISTNLAPIFLVLSPDRQICTLCSGHLKHKLQVAEMSCIPLHLQNDFLGPTCWLSYVILVTQVKHESSVRTSPILSSPEYLLTTVVGCSIYYTCGWLTFSAGTATYSSVSPVTSAHHTSDQQPCLCHGWLGMGDAKMKKTWIQTLNF